MPLNLRGTAAAILSLVTVSGAETAFAQKHGGILRICHWDSPVSMSIHEEPTYTDLLKFLDASVSFYLGHGSTAGASYGADEAGAQATAQSERTKPVLVANRFHAISQASMMSARLRNTELASQWLRR